MRQTIAEVHKDTIVLETYLLSTEPGQSIPYTDLEMDTGIKMDETGKRRLRAAAKRARKIISTVRGFGIVMSSGENAYGIMSSGLQRLNNQAIRQEKVTNSLLHQHAEAIPQDERNSMCTVAAMFATVRVLADRHKREIREHEMRRQKILAAPVRIPE